MVVHRGDEPESVHVARAVVVGLEPGEEIHFGEPDTRAFWRSSMKPFQALAAVEDGAFETFGLEEADLALACASHRGLPEQVDRVAAMLERLSLGEDALACGPHPPFAEEAAEALLRAGREPGRLHNNCSGKHAAMLALARHHGWPTDAYEAKDSRVQERIRRGLAAWLDVDPEALAWGIDGCGVPTPYLSLRQMARAYARLVRSEAPAARRVVGAMTAHPQLVSGPGALPTRLMEATGGRVLVKEGAEGVLCAAARSAGWAAALKVLDGARRAIGPAFLEMSAGLGLLGADELEALEPLRHPPVRDTRTVQVGWLEAEAVPQRAPVTGGMQAG